MGRYSSILGYKPQPSQEHTNGKVHVQYTRVCLCSLKTIDVESKLEAHGLYPEEGGHDVMS